ncbi:MAG: serine/threonine-protein kinase [Candidatus Sulfotelmatobacter sp.]
MDDRKRERFGRYEILAELGRGSMGVVYKARDPKINRVVAVKTVSLEGQPAEEEREYRERFLREAEAAGRLSHPGIVTIFDVGEEPETRSPYIVMEFVGGPSLDKLRKIPLETALQLTLEMADALDCAHGQGVVHRDLKPANILLTQDGHAKIADFGVAKLNLANQTLGERVLGTPSYMSPEQLNGEAVDGRSDLFSLGVILYTILTGYRPFQGNSAATVSFKVVNREPVLATVLETDLPAGLDFIIARAMAKDPAQRYQRGMEMVLDIQELREGREPWSKTKQPGWSPGIGAAQPANAQAGSWATGQRVAAATPRLSKGALRRDAVEKLLEKIRKNSFASVGMLLGGLLVLGIGLSQTVWRQKPPSRSLAGSDAVKTLSPESAPGLVATGVTPAQPSSAKVSPATLDIEVEHNFTQARLSVWVDGHSIYTHLLEGTDKKRLVVFHGVQGHASHAMQLAPGKHRVRIRVVSGVDAYDQSGTVAGEFVAGKEKVLRIHFNKRGELNLSLQ